MDDSFIKLIASVVGSVLDSVLKCFNRVLDSILGYWNKDKELDYRLKRLIIICFTIVLIILIICLFLYYNNLH